MQLRRCFLYEKSICGGCCCCGQPFLRTRGQTKPCLILVPRWLSTLLRILDSGVRTWDARRYPMKIPDWNWRIHFIFSTCYRCTKLTSLRIGGCWMVGCLLVVHVFPTPTSRVVREAYIHKGDQIWGFGGRVLRRYLPRAGGVRLVATHHLGVCLFYTIVN